MDFSLSPELEELRHAVRRFVVAELHEKVKPLRIHAASLPESMGAPGPAGKRRW